MHRGRLVSRVSAMQPVTHTLHYLRTSRFFGHFFASLSCDRNKKKIVSKKMNWIRNSPRYEIKKLFSSLRVHVAHTLRIWLGDRFGSNERGRISPSGWLDPPVLRRRSGPSDESRIEARAVLSGMERASGSTRLFSASSRARVGSPHATSRFFSAMYAKRVVNVPSRNCQIVRKSFQNVKNFIT